jgi:hypothetical protein
MIRLQDQSVVVDMEDILKRGLGEYAVEILAHEIGHHVLAPASLMDHGRLIARVRAALPTFEQHAPMIANLYTDLLINDRLQRVAGLRLSAVYSLIRVEGDAGALWSLYMRIYELLWSLEKGTLGGRSASDQMEGDAILGCRLIRNYATEWLDGAGRFATLVFPYLVEESEARDQFESWADTKKAGDGGEIPGLTSEDPAEKEGAIHPSVDPALNDTLPEVPEPDQARQTGPAEGQRGKSGGGQTREPFRYGEILRAAGLSLDDHEIAVRYYRERALPYLVPFPTRRSPAGSDPLPEGLEPWDIGDPLDEIEWFQTILQSPAVVPGMTTVKRMWGVSEGVCPKLEPIDLDIYVDCSGSMANPQITVSYPALAGSILCLSALRAGARVKATLWSGAGQFDSTNGFIRNETAILRVLTGYFGGGTAFPIHVLRDTYLGNIRRSRPVHILVISDDGVTTMFDHDERGGDGWQIVRLALERAGGGGTFVLNLPKDWESHAENGAPYSSIKRARNQMGWAVYQVSAWEDLLAFAKSFARAHYSRDGRDATSLSRVAVKAGTIGGNQK